MMFKFFLLFMSINIFASIDTFKEFLNNGKTLKHSYVLENSLKFIDDNTYIPSVMKFLLNNKDLLGKEFINIAKDKLGITILSWKSYAEYVLKNCPNYDLYRSILILTYYKDTKEPLLNSIKFLKRGDTALYRFITTNKECYRTILNVYLLNYDLKKSLNVVRQSLFVYYEDHYDKEILLEVFSLIKYIIESYKLTEYELLKVNSILFNIVNMIEINMNIIDRDYKYVQTQKYLEDILFNKKFYKLSNTKEELW